MRSGAAYLGGVKGNYATIGLTASVPLNDCPGQNNTGFHVASIAKWAQDYGMSTGENELYSSVFYDFESAAQSEAQKSVSSKLIMNLNTSPCLSLIHVWFSPFFFYLASISCVLVNYLDIGCDDRFRSNCGPDAAEKGLITTTQVTHASPAGVYAHIANRNWESNQQLVDDGADPRLCSDIAMQLVHGDVGKNLKVSGSLFRCLADVALVARVDKVFSGKCNFSFGRRSEH